MQLPRSRRTPVTPEEAALFGVRRLLELAGPDGFVVEVTDDDDVIHTVDVYLWGSELISERRVDAPQDDDAGPDAPKGAR